MSDLSQRLATALAGRYRIERELGRGGMATVFLAEDLKHQRPVALKVLDPEIATVIGPERFLREIGTIARLTHPHILPLHDSGDADGLPFYVMPYVEGESLRVRLDRDKQLPVEDALRIAREVAEALSYAHGRGVVHRDIKPENVLLEEGHAVVADFGIARAVVAAGGEKLTATGIAVGTPAYMSPEQATGGRDLDGRSDLYGLGCVLYEMLAGQPPFTGPTAESLAHQHLNVTPRPVTELRPAVPAAVAAVLGRALAKTPADRFGTAALLGEALGRSESDPTDTTRPMPAVLSSKRRTRWVLAAGGTLLVVGAVVLSQHWGAIADWIGGRGGGPPARKDWILVAEFDGPADDSTLASTTRELVSAALDQSEIAATVPRDQIRLALEMAGKPANTRVTPEIARELAYRSSVRAVVEGTIGRLGPGYSVALRVVDADSAKLILTEWATAQNEDGLISALGRLAERLRAGLGERRQAIQATRPMTAVATPSFEGYRFYLRGYGLVLSARPREAVPLLREALALDPDFALARAALGTAYANMQMPDSAEVALDQALRLPQRLTAVQRFKIEGDVAGSRGDLQLAITAYERVLQYDPTNPAVLSSLGVRLLQGGRFEEALEATRKSNRAYVFGVTQNNLGNESVILRCLGRFDEARGVVRSMKGPQVALSSVLLELTAACWSAAESLAVATLADPALDQDRRAQFLTFLGSAQVARGALLDGEANFERAEGIARGGTAGIVRWNQVRRNRLMLATVSDGAIPLPTTPWPDDTSTATLLSRGLQAAMAGAGAQANELLNATRSRSRRELAWQGATPELLEARVEALKGNWNDAAHVLQPIASRRVEAGGPPYPAGLSAIRWFLAEAFERLDQPDSTAAYLERIISDPASATNREDIVLRSLATPFAHRRLVLLYARMGRIEDARRHWKILSETVRTPDRKLAPLMAEARSALLAAEGMTKSARR